MILKRLCAALTGRSFWLKLDRKYKVNDGGLFVLLMPENDQELNEQALRHIDDMIAFRRAKGVVILTDQSQILESAQQYSKQIIAVQKVTANQINQLLSFYELYEFSERLLIVSLHKPYGRQVHKTIGIYGITKEEVVCICIYQIRDWKPAEE